MIFTKAKMRKRVAIFTVLAMMCSMLVAMTACGKKEPIGKSPINTLDDLANAKIGVQLGTTGDIYVTDEYPNATIQHFNKGADAIQSLKQGKVDCVVIDKLPAEAFVALNKDLSILDEEFTDEDYAIAVAKGNNELLGKINDALNELEENGIKQKIIDNYIGDNKGSYEYVTPKGTDKSNGRLVMATNAAFEPYEYVEGGKIVGIDADMALAISDILGMELVIEDMEFDSVITAVSSGKADMGMAGLTVTEDRLKSINFSESYTTSTQVIVVRNGESDDLSIFSLERYKNNFIKDNRWKYIAEGLLTTLEISFFAVVIGVVLGFVFAIIRASSDKTGKLKLLNALVKVYVTIIRGTPVMIQLLIIYYVIFASTNINKVLVAVLAFGLNSAAYMTEIVRSGIMSIDNGQFEAGRSLGFNYVQTMRHFILPQAFKNVLPAIGNELIVLIKETSISGYIGIMDMTRGADYIRSRTYDAFPPLIAVAIVYLIIVMILTALVGKLERRLKTDGK
ncbi:MAG: ABC transporter substrate-binding protein/permease [Lachnospiraceae bacterium]|nr:ABC transporter substrate-binding protein/permease [Lachnospiraceae bacterium]